MFNYADRAKLCPNPAAKKLLQIIAEKKTNLSLSADVTQASELLKLAQAVGPEICMLKTHIDIIEDFTPSLCKQLVDLANEHQFIIFEDRKFADIGNTVKLQYQKGVYHIAEWAALTNAHVITGPGVIAGLKEIGLPLGNALLLLAELSSQGNLITSAYTQTAVALAQQHKDFVIGFITQHQLTEDPTFIHACPGVHISSSGDALGQGYITPQQAIVEQGNDIIIVGRGIYGDANPQHVAQYYRQIAWEAHQRLIAA